LLNVFPARYRTFVAKLSADLHLGVSWDEYDDQDQNLVTRRLPGAVADDDESSNDQEVADEREDESPKI
jgi:hypothetical protein